MRKKAKDLLCCFRENVVHSASPRPHKPRPQKNGGFKNITNYRQNIEMAGLFLAEAIADSSRHFGSAFLATVQSKGVHQGAIFCQKMGASCHNSIPKLTPQLSERIPFLFILDNIPFPFSSVPVLFATSSGLHLRLVDDTFTVLLHTSNCCRKAKKNIFFQFLI